MPLFSLHDPPPAPQSKSRRPAADLRLLEDTFHRFKTLVVDPTEFACLKAVVSSNQQDSRRLDSIFNWFCGVRGRPCWIRLEEQHGGVKLGRYRPQLSGERV
ncbi:hypothetical protein WMY93_023210 [Mugilogobius chulae]|uniref:Uncharacterized protein n=1 Tax=Mugilogobius chulae TaxID=88201 RepID=A0AAW0N965_9GOBI